MGTQLKREITSFSESREYMAEDIGHPSIKDKRSYSLFLNNEEFLQKVSKLASDIIPTSQIFAVIGINYRKAHTIFERYYHFQNSILIGERARTELELKRFNEAVPKSTEEFQLIVFRFKSFLEIFDKYSLTSKLERSFERMDLAIIKKDMESVEDSSSFEKLRQKINKAISKKFKDSAINETWDRKKFQIEDQSKNELE